jgi:hypothetical protein
MSLLAALLVVGSAAQLHAQDNIRTQWQGRHIHLTDVPAWGEADRLLGGQVSGVAVADHRVAVYIRVGGWWTKPTFEAPLTSIDTEGYWSCDIATGRYDPEATRIMAFLVPAGYQPPRMEGGGSFPADLYRSAIDSALVVRNYRRQVDFSGFRWSVKTGSFPQGPGPNLFTDDEDALWVDADGLHMTLTRRDSLWRATEIVADTVLGYGTYTLKVRGAFDLLDAHAVFGFFTWDELAPDQEHREIDIEMSRWGEAGVPNAQFVVQPYTAPGHRHRFDTMPGAQVSSLSFSWSAGAVRFRSATGVDEGSVTEWTYEGADIPDPGQANPRLNLWWMQGLAPTDGNEVELIITDFEFVPEGTVTAVTQSADATLPGASRLAQSYPNPFNGETVIPYSLHRRGDVHLAVYSVTGQLITVLVEGVSGPGRYNASWRGVDADGAPVASGVYYYRLSVGDEQVTKSMLMLQ